MQILEVFETKKPAKSLAAFTDHKIGIKRVERIAVFVSEADTVILDLKTADFWATTIQL